MPSPEAIARVQIKHIRVLERRCRYLLGMHAIDETNDFDKAEIGALLVAIAELNEVYQARVDAGEIPQAVEDVPA